MMIAIVSEVRLVIQSGYSMGGVKFNVIKRENLLVDKDGE